MGKKAWKILERHVANRHRGHQQENEVREDMGPSAYTSTLRGAITISYNWE
jgi:hypothetical protein